MTIDTNQPAFEHAAHRANGDTARAENLKVLAELSASANRSQQAEHIRGIVAATMAHLAADATLAAKDSAAQWQQWALGLTDDLALDLAAPAVNS